MNNVIFYPFSDQTWKVHLFSDLLVFPFCFFSRYDIAGCDSKNLDNRLDNRHKMIINKMSQIYNVFILCEVSFRMQRYYVETQDRT